MKAEKAYAKIIAKAWNDPKFKERLLKNPEVVFKENGVELPPGEKIQIHENTGKIVHLVLPKSPVGTKEMSEIELEKAAGGLCGVDWHENSKCK